MLFRSLIAAALIAPVSAAADVYNCETTNFGRGGWISDVFFFDFNAKTGKATALDQGINHVHKKAIPVKFKARSNTSYNFHWTIDGLPSNNVGSAKVSYKVTLFSDRKSFNVNDRLHGYDNVISGLGKCRKTG